MKRLLALMMALAMCLSLCACGGDEEPVTEPEILNEPPAATITDHPLLGNVYGEWMLTDVEHKDNYLFANVVINEDGTAIVDGEELVWQISERFTNDTQLAICFYRGGEEIVGALYEEEGWFCCLSIDGAIYPSAYANRATATPEQLRAADPDTYVMPLICGTWLLTQEKEEMPKEVVLKEDYTCTLDGVSYTWTMENQNGSQFVIQIMNGSTTVHSGTIFNVYAGELGFSLDNTYYANPNLYDIVEITVENWLDYFEIVPSATWTENAFGETEGLYFYTFDLILKEEYYPRLSRVVHNGNVVSKGAMEVTFSVDKQMCDVDLENQTITPLEGAASFYEQYTDMYKLKFTRSSGKDVFGTGFYGWGSYLHDGKSIANIYDLELVRVACPLYFIKDEYFVVEE